MKRLRFLIVTIVLWLFLLYNIERLSQPINISSVAYIFIAIAVTLTILLPQLHRVPLWLVLIGPMPVFLILKLWLGYPFRGAAILLTVTEISFIAVTSLLARQVNHVLGEFERVVADITIDMVGKPTVSFAAGQGEMYREVRRARTFHRPLALIAVGIEEETLRNSLPRMAVEAQRAIGKHLVLAGLAKVLDQELEDHHIIAKQNEHLIVLLPETKQEDLAPLKQKLRASAAKWMDVTLKIGTASLSDGVVTFERLVEEATVEMMSAEEPRPSLERLEVHQPPHLDTN
jgi:hypothetical protein